VGTLADELDRTPLPFDNATLHLMNALGNVHDTTDVMDEKGRILLRLASLHDHRIGGYQRLPEERGPSPGPASLRLRALGLLARSNLFLNDELVRQFLLEKALTSKDSREEWLVAGPASRVFTTQTEPRYGRRLLATWLERSRARLSAPADPLSLEALLVHVNYLGAYADTYGMEGAVKDLLDSVVNADGAVSSTAGIDGGAHDLASRAVVALADIEDGPRVRKWFEPDAPFPTRVRRSPYDGVLDDTTIVDWPRAVLESRLRTLDDEIAALGKESRGRCALVHQRATMTPERAQAALFDAWTTSADVPECELFVAFGLDSVPVSKRARVAAKLLAEADPKRFPAPRTLVAESVLGEHPEWIEADEGLRRSIVERALGETPLGLWQASSDISGLDIERSRFAFQAAVERALVSFARSREPGEREKARALVRHFSELYRKGLGARISSAYGYDNRRALLFTVANVGPRVGLEREVSALIDEPTEGDEWSRRVARYLFERAKKGLP
jgi:hypothetical protein